MAMATDTTATHTARKNSLIDLHCHILPGIDDGSKSIEESLKLANDAVADGIGYILATPHHLDRHYVNHARDVQKAVDDFQDILNERKIPLTIFPGQEVHLNGDLVDRLDDLLGIDSAMNYLLVEFPHEQVPQYATDLFFQLSLQGITPVIAHPERNAQIQKQPELLYQFIADGALGQLTSTSLIGTFGKKVQRFSEELIAHGMVHVLSSDAHALPNREFKLREAYLELDRLDRNYGPQFYQNSKHLLNGEPINHQIELTPTENKRRFLF
ncbi:tyrosine-protein phosphatase [Lapidilactobacillus bayanensis]|uniref:tyrosine-protein phosphatase n=1 Tax=Lapidilactobacillus bayanensis TaxID=2485998 RepID=UPI001CDC807C|nr:CpsB/CapC family capsule biosynthesis tyrosine phosphatase [Lapidilactobacillus bayanensis]